MANIREVVKQIHSVTATQQITKAMKMVAAAKLHKIQPHVQHLRAYAEKLEQIFVQVTTSTRHPISPPYTQERPIQKLLLVIITSDKGLCGSFNSNVFKQLIDHIHLWTTSSSVQIDLLVIGRKALNFVQKWDRRVITDYMSLAHHLSLDQIIQATTFLIGTFCQHIYDRIELIYNRFISMARQAVEVEQFLPITKKSTQVQCNTIDYIYEPSKAILAKELAPRLLEIQLYKALVESNAAEHGARMTTMWQATENAEELLKTLRIHYNRTRQAAITREISEIVAGAEAIGDC